MHITLATGNQRGVVLELDLLPGHGWARHLDGVVIWRASRGYERFEALSPTSAEGPYALGGVLFCQASASDPSETLEHVAARLLSERGDVADIEYVEMYALPAACLAWTDGVACVLSSVLRPAPDVLLAIEYTVSSHLEADRGGARPFSDPASLLRAIRSTVRASMDRGHEMEIEKDPW